MRASALALAVAALAVPAAGCGGDDDDAGEPAKPVGKQVAGSVVQFADCRDWRRGTVEEREATIDELKSQLTPQTAETPKSALDDEKAYEILDKSCKPEFADRLRLYKLYVKAQGFSPLYE